MGSKQLLEPGPETLSGSTPVTIPDDECCLNKETTVSSSSKNVQCRWYFLLWNLMPCCLVVVSMVQVVMWLVAEDRMCRLLRWEPARRSHVWRLGSYMLLHRGVMHLAINVVLQILLAAPLEREQGGMRTLAVYVVGGIAGALGATLIKPQPIVGASAGVYALLTSHLAHLYLNMFTLKYRKYRVFSVCVLAATDIVFCCMHARTASISVGAHWTGGVIGALFGLVVYRGDPHRLLRVAAALVVLLLFVGSALALALLPDSYFSTKV